MASTQQVKQRQDATNATMSNKTISQMELGRSNNWYGSPANGSFPGSIPVNQRAMFIHLKDDAFRSKAAVQYDGSNAIGDACSWLMAWDAPADKTSSGPPTRVYVACGNKAIIDSMTWDEILINLDKAQSYATSSDKATKTSIDANISQAADLATLIANFRVIV